MVYDRVRKVIINEHPALSIVAKVGPSAIFALRILQPNRAQVGILKLRDGRLLKDIEGLRLVETRRFDVAITRTLFVLYSGDFENGIPCRVFFREIVDRVDLAVSDPKIVLIVDVVVVIPVEQAGLII